MHHCFFSHGLRSLFLRLAGHSHLNTTRPDRVRRHDRPASARSSATPLRRITTGFSEQARFGLLIQLWLCPGAWTLLQYPQPRFDETLAEAFDRRAPDREGSSDSTVFPTLSRFE